MNLPALSLRFRAGVCAGRRSRGCASAQATLLSFAVVSCEPPWALVQSTHRRESTCVNMQHPRSKRSLDNTRARRRARDQMLRGGPMGISLHRRGGAQDSSLASARRRRRLAQGCAGANLVGLGQVRIGSSRTTLSRYWERGNTSRAAQRWRDQS